MSQSKVSAAQPISEGKQKPTNNFTRRKAVGLPIVAALSTGLGGLPKSSFSADSTRDNRLIKICLNTSTINGQKIPVPEQLTIAAQAGYDSVELWVRDIRNFCDLGGRPEDIKAQLSDLGLSLDGAIAFGAWCVDDDAQRASALEQYRKDMELIRSIGGSSIAAPPVGATSPPRLNLDRLAERYRDLLEIGRQLGVAVQLELWGFSHNLSTLQDLLYVGAAADHPNVCFLLDIYHLYKGGSSFKNLDIVSGRKLPCVHINDYPAQPDRLAIADKDRVYPGDGIAPVSDILATFLANGFSGTLSLELFNQEYYRQPPEQVAKKGLTKMKQAFELALGR